MDDWASRIKELEAAGWSLTDLASAVGLSTSALSDIKRGASKAPRGMAAVTLHAIHASKRLPPSAGPEPKAA